RLTAGLVTRLATRLNPPRLDDAGLIALRLLARFQVHRPLGRLVIVGAIATPTAVVGRAIGAVTAHLTTVIAGGAAIAATDAIDRSAGITGPARGIATIADAGRRRDAESPEISAGHAPASIIVQRAFPLAGDEAFATG